MSLSTQLMGIAAGLLLISAVLYVVFGQVTVRKLRKNPETRDALGLELASGWDILNVAGALSRPRWMSLRLRASRLKYTAADERPIYTHTNKFDRFIGRLFFYTWIISIVVFLTVGFASQIGLID